MATKYTLTCECGRKWRVEARQAGEEIACSCGGRVIVPTLRGLSELPQVEEQAAPASRWTKAQGILFVAALAWLAFGVGMTWWCYVQAAHPVRQFRIDDEAEDLSGRVDQFTLTESMKYWKMFRQQPGRMLHGSQQPKGWDAGSPRYKWLTWVAAGVTVVGVVVLGAATVGASSKRRNVGS
jgi:hypothetical protein